MKKTSSEHLRIGEVAARAGIRTSSIRYYESVGVLPSPNEWPASDAIRLKSSPA